jgi:glycosyltransferase involved in cell wall biosynthesis
MTKTTPSNSARRKQVRVLHVLGSLDPGGVETWLLNVLKYADKDIFQFHFCTSGANVGLYAAEVEKLGGRVFRCPKDLTLRSFQRTFRGILREGNYDILHSHVYFFSGILLRWANKEAVPIRIAHSHTSRDDRPDTYTRRWYRALMRSWINRYATSGLAASKLAALELFGKNWSADRRFRVIRCGIDLHAFQEPIDRSAVRNGIGIPLNAPVVGNVANFLPAKNHSFILEIATQILKRRPEIHFLLVGDGPLRPRIQAEATARGLSNRMHFVGTRADVPRLMRGAMNFYLFPSLNEGFGVSLLEAQMAGLDCVVSDTVPREVSYFPEHIEFIPLSAGIEHWAKRVISKIDLLSSKPILIPDDDTLDRISIQRSVRDLTNIYLTAQTPRIPATAEQHA